MKVWIDGAVVEGSRARVPVTDHGFLYGDGIFDSSDMVTAFADGGYEKGLRTDAVAVPEPSAWGLLMLGVVALLTMRRSA